MRRCTAVVSLVLGAAEVARAAPPPVADAHALLLPLTPKDFDAIQFTRPLPGENLGDGGGFSVRRSNYIRIDGRHLTIRTAAGLQRCVVTPAQAKSLVFGERGAADCKGIHLAKRPNPRVKSDDGEPVIVTVAQGARRWTIAGLWQGTD